MILVFKTSSAADMQLAHDNFMSCSSIYIPLRLLDYEAERKLNTCVFLFLSF